MSTYWWAWPTPGIPKSLQNRYPDFLEPAKWRRGHEIGMLARCQGPKCSATYVVLNRHHFFHSRPCGEATHTYWRRWRKLPKAPIFKADLMAYRPEHDEFWSDFSLLEQ